MCTCTMDFALSEVAKSGYVKTEDTSLYNFKVVWLCKPSKVVISQFVKKLSIDYDTTETEVLMHSI